MMGRYVDRRLVLMLRRPTGRTFAQWDAESQVKFALRSHDGLRNTMLLLHLTRFTRLARSS